MGYMKYLKQTFLKEMKEKNEDYRARLIQYRKEPVTIRLEHPTRIDRAKALGYKAKQGVFVVRQRVSGGAHERERNIKGKRSRNAGKRKNLRKNYQWIAEERASKKYVNCEVLNSYFVAKDGQHFWYEIILVDKDHPSVKNDKSLGWITQPQHTRRVFRGLTSAGRKSRGLMYKGKGAEKARPSRGAVQRHKQRRQFRKTFF
jgi:large subunit ribosomal protein L15e